MLYRRGPTWLVWIPSESRGSPRQWRHVEVIPRSRCAQPRPTVIDVRGGGVVLMSQSRALGSVCAWDARTEAVEDVQDALGEGPCVDALRSRSPVLVSDLGAWTEAAGRLFESARSKLVSAEPSAFRLSCDQSASAHRGAPGGGNRLGPGRALAGRCPRAAGPARAQPRAAAGTTFVIAGLHG
jgi:hypothetical protein